MMGKRHSMNDARVVMTFALLAYASALAPCMAQSQPVTPIEHLVVIIGENTSFDAMFGGYSPPEGQKIWNLLSKKIINPDGSPGPNYREAQQKIPKANGTYQINFAESVPYATLPLPHRKAARGAPAEIDTRVPSDLPPGQFQITRYLPRDAFTGSDPVHRFFQNWQQLNAGRNDLFIWVGMTSGEGAADRKNPSSATEFSSEPMGFFNMSTGDWPYFSQLSRTFAISDNYHQPIMGGTGPNYFALATAGDAARFLIDGAPSKPFENQIENPEPVAGSANWYKQDGYSSGSYTACSDDNQPGVGAIRTYLKSLPYAAFKDGNCEPGSYYLVNNYYSAYNLDGTQKVLAPSLYVTPVQTAPTIADALSAKGISWRWYNGGREGAGFKKGEYSPVVDPLTYFKTVMETDLKRNLVGDTELFADISGAMPAVAFVTPPLSRNGHPNSSTPGAFEDYARSIIEKIQANDALWKKTAILITTDEAGGYYDSGYTQTIDFFGDGPRIPLIAVSPWARKGHVEHTYYDHVSIDKFIERNWSLKPLSHRTRDNLPNPTTNAADPYTPSNRPAIGDLFELFDFGTRMK